MDQEIRALLEKGEKDLKEFMLSRTEIAIIYIRKSQSQDGNSPRVRLSTYCTPDIRKFFAFVMELGVFDTVIHIDNERSSVLAETRIDNFRRSLTEVGFSVSLHHKSEDTRVFIVRGNPSLVANPARNPDFYDMLRQFDVAARDLREHIRRTNDPKRQNNEIVMLRALLGSLIEFLDVSGNAVPDKLSVDIPEQAKSSIKSQDWTKWPDAVSKLSDAVLGWLNFFFPSNT